MLQSQLVACGCLFQPFSCGHIFEQRILVCIRIFRAGAQISNCFAQTKNGAEDFLAYVATKPLP
jgi:hypothetical protein